MKDAGLKTALSATSGRQNIQTKETSHRCLFFLCFLAQKHAPNITKTAKNTKKHKNICTCHKFFVTLCGFWFASLRKPINHKFAIINHKY